MQIRLGELAVRLGVSLRGDGEVVVDHVAQLDSAGAGSLSFLGDPAYRAHLARTHASAVILKESDAADARVPVLLSDNPYLTFARAVRLLHPQPEVVGGIHPSAVVDPGAQVDPTAWIGPLTVLEAGVVVGPRVFVGPGCILGEGVEVGADSRLTARVTLCAGTRVGQRALIHPGAVIGREGFGFAKDGERWVRIPQVGRALLGDDVEIGANTSVDRGAIGDTVIGHGVKLDNHIQIGHNVVVGDNTAMAANTGISGSTRIGRNCTIAGAVGMAGHLEIGDNVHFTGMAMVTRSFKEPGVYSSGIPAMPNADWRRNAARFRHLDELTRRVKQLETLIANMNATHEREES
ncbi:UDP-3-O-(3-hydroxymyristoyl)glucosamine N-acyltransferase [Allochromatium vinosum]|uniref:UDP-3-O-acylglucosamine N-acyltransferase n=1 Tax=Allochromatium vinosum (strain ATCC 17899 / DSM 180 / NBRC 103801 / NCIMB 10441 / D) TaxID=572477 RepID=D3RV44_ALLVD|nr:UDP-3-O-(3-hydroxymyristoyl)glucosamine N-acyltransferase [Allochromatium vinosum]ADC62976.1 UDP-3-O-(3-hydroxymyristoyl) glucosamine N-acyltransferase [Allochromatium vinosum DSM 180]MBK1655593.1 UDP-3-O-(3-hydroxymyristoyl)glucosamine N-acyltransferase [Allochromatium vinosum]